MRLITISFSPTGGTKKVVDMLAEAMPGERLQLDLTDAGEGYRRVTIRLEDLCLIAMPVYGGRAPVLAMERFRSLQGNGSKCLLAAVYGNRDYEDTLAEMQDAAEERGFIVTGAVAAVAEHSVVRSIATGRPDAQDREALHRAAGEWLDALRDHRCVPQIPGNRPYTKPMSLRLVPKRTRACTGCGACRAACPASAIGADFVADPGACISCMRCIGVCPAGARKANAMMVGLSRAVLKKDCQERKDMKVFLA